MAVPMSEQQTAVTHVLYTCEICKDIHVRTIPGTWTLDDIFGITPGDVAAAMMKQ